jgi:ribosomal protein S18 acetylase RimI-like enzyme
MAYYEMSNLKNITYTLNAPISKADFIRVLKSSGLAERRPINDLKCITGMLENANLTVVAKIGDKVIGIARSVTDFYYCCYLSDLAVDKDYQQLGIGKMLIQKTMGVLGEQCKLILLSAPNAIGYYPKLGFKKHNQAWVLDKKDQLK